MPPRASKLQRWTDLLAALLRRHYPATFDDLARDIPGYLDSSKKKDALMRMFERDKDELRSFGIAIETQQIEDGEATGYRLEKKGFYLPYLSLAREGKGAPHPRKPDKYGYRALASLVLEPDELAVIAQAANRVRALGDPVLTEEVDSAIRKIAFDLPLRDVESVSDPERAVHAAAPRDSVFEAMNDALTRRKSVTFDYRTMATDKSSRRTIEPYGLFFLSSHWYVAGRDPDRLELRNFRLNRISNAAVNPKKSQSTDYEIPASFDLRRHATSRQAWELGDGATDDAIVDFRNPTGAAKAAARLGVAVEGAGDRRKFKFRRLDSFARWLLSFGGEAIPVEPPELVTEFDQQLTQTRAIYGDAR